MPASPTPAAPDLALLDAVGQAELVRDGACSPLELVDAAIARIEALDPRLNAVIHRRFEQARAEAAAGDLPEGPFRGVPLCIKDAVAHTAGDPYHAGMAFLRDRGWTEATDSNLAARFRAAGFVLVGKTNTPELAATITTEPKAHGPSRNPWDPTRSTGGSSGGSAAAVASGMVPVAHGNDMGGSIRIPAGECALVGLKPTRARTSLGPAFGEFWGPLTHEGVLTRTVRDTAAVLDVLAGMAPGDPYTAPPLTRPLAEEVGAEPGRLRIGLRRTEPFSGAAAHPDCDRAVDAAAALLEGLGHRVADEAPAALDTTPGNAVLVFCAYLARDLDRWAARTGDAIGPDDVEPGTWALASMGRALSAADYLAAVEDLQAWARTAAAWWAAPGTPGLPTGLEGQGWDLLVSPTLPIPPPELGRDPMELTDLVSFALPWNLTGQPAMAVPLWWNDDGLPIGIQLVAAYGREDLLIRVAAQLEQAAPWDDRLPPIHAAHRADGVPAARAPTDR